MEKRQLDFNAPLLSARRLSSPRNSFELVHRKPVEKRAPPEESPTKPAAVPFNWEQIPGRAKNEPKPKPKARFPGQAHSGEPKSNHGPTNQTIYINQHASLIEKLDESFNCKDESEYSDTINALSLNDSCSSVNSSVRPSGMFSVVDEQTRDFMMSRFLPAAKAVVVLENPQYAAKKTVVGPTDEGVVKEVKKKVVSYYGTEDFDGGESEDEEDDGERGTLVPVVKKAGAGKSWGIIPRICVKRSMCLLKPIPAMKSSSRHPTPTAGEERRLRRNPFSGPLDKGVISDGGLAENYMNGLQLHPPPKKYHSGFLSPDNNNNNNNSKSSSHDSYPLLSSRESPLRRYPSRSIPKEMDTKIASSRKMFNALLDVSSQKNQATVEKTLYVDSVSKTASSKYADEVKDVKKYLSGGVGLLGVKEEIDGFGGSCGPVPPPLLKSPSESWLWRTLPFGQSRRHLSRDQIR
ncbi:hypothetical protein STAS_07826 [Striga asiatica]|uniref:Uncharacterized protein n=1 Tax=Striga asiatica TaxID=4170 RepID=A0A5A7PFX7_STRAF|nr:hypothetical protein STAS_07826 [Striga asiatica]